MQHHEFYDCTTSIQANATEIELRNAMSRLYYYVYHEILSIISQNEDLSLIYQGLEGSSHQRLQNTFFNYTTRTRKLIYTEISQLLKALHKLRCDADYELNDKIVFSDFNSMLAQLQTLKSKFQMENATAFNIDIVFPKKVMVVQRTNKQDIQPKKPEFHFVEED